MNRLDDQLLLELLKRRLLPPPAQRNGHGIIMDGSQPQKASLGDNYGRSPKGVLEGMMDNGQGENPYPEFLAQDAIRSGLR